MGDAIEPGSDNVERVQRAGIEAMTAVARTKLELLANRSRLERLADDLPSWSRARGHYRLPWRMPMPI
ncbi:MAG TPA: hypothetical protein VFY45_02735 [Baekduia sp.]|nr:hypothetical protein [Baekduia sp.]